MFSYVSEDQEILSNKLPRPTFVSADDSSITNFNSPGNATSIFSNPFRDAEQATVSALEKHVRMTMPTEKQNEINGRQICWNYRKGKCRFGHNCKFAHDSDIPIDNRLDPNDHHNSNMRFQSQIPYHQITHCEASFGVTMDENGNEEDGDYDIDGYLKKKKRPGLCPSLVPSKKVMKQYYKQQQIERPWSILK